MPNENKTAKEYVKKGYLIAHLANCGIRTINYDEWERLCECIHEAKPADVAEVVRCKDCIHHKRFMPCEDWRQEYICDVFEWKSKDDDFCSFAERRTE